MGVRLASSGLAEDLGITRTNEHQIVSFSLGEEYGVPIEQVQEIIRIGNITIVPNSPAYMEGVINLRGKVVPVLNLRRKLGLPQTPITKKSRILVIEIKGKLIGALVDSVSHVLKITSESVEEPPEDILDRDTDYITGICKLPRTLVILLDLEKLLARENGQELAAGEARPFSGELPEPANGGKKVG
jgi:purine-binding chemotaxis protein CheW